MGVAMVHGPRQFFTFGPWSHPHLVMWSLWSVESGEQPGSYPAGISGDQFLPGRDAGGDD